MTIRPKEAQENQYKVDEIAHTKAARLGSDRLA